MSTKLLNELIYRLQNLLEGNPKNTGPSIRERNINVTLSYNFYSNLEQNWIILENILDSFFIFNKNLPEGEIIVHKGSSGKIFDTQVESFEVLKSKIYECYFYRNEDFLYVRLLWERELKKDGPKNQWLSLDIDLVKESAWFTEKKIRRF
ncbi:MAG: hypothetical protein ACFFD1_08305 [Candidatus Thorarchaeota archaeon]